MDDKSTSGANSFVKLAILVLGIVPNSASTERVFSQMGITHTRLRNRLKAEKLDKTIKLKMDLKSRFRDDSTTRLKRKFQELTASMSQAVPALSSSTTYTSTTSLATPSIPNTSSPRTVAEDAQDGLNDNAEHVPELQDNERFLQVVAPLITSATEDDIELLSDEDPFNSSHAESTPISASLTTTGTTEITFENGLLLKNLFDFSNEDDFVTFSWSGGWSSLEGETIVYEILAAGGDIEDAEEEQ